MLMPDGPAQITGTRASRFCFGTSTIYPLPQRVAFAALALARGAASLKLPKMPIKLLAEVALRLLMQVRKPPGPPVLRHDSRRLASCGFVAPLHGAAPIYALGTLGRVEGG